MNIELPPRQKEVLKWIVTLTGEKGYPPTLAELAKALGLRNRMTVHQHVAALKKKGLVKWEQGLNRSLRVVEAESQEIQEQQDHGSLMQQPKFAHSLAQTPVQKGIPLVGTIAAGQPLDAHETNEYLELEGSYVSSGCFALKVKGDSMVEDGIYDKDYVIIKPNPSPNNGEIVVALLEDGSATLKRFYKEKSGYRLQPANSNMNAIHVDALNALQIQGTAVALFRKLS